MALILPILLMSACDQESNGIVIEQNAKGGYCSSEEFFEYNRKFAEDHAEQHQQLHIPYDGEIITVSIFTVVYEKPDDAYGRPMRKTVAFIDGSPADEELTSGDMGLPAFLPACEE